MADDKGWIGADFGLSDGERKALRAVSRGLKIDDLMAERLRDMGLIKQGTGGPMFTEKGKIVLAKMPL